MINPSIKFAEYWKKIEETGIAPLKDESKLNNTFKLSISDKMKIYTAVYDLCCKSKNDVFYGAKLHEKFNLILEEFIKAKCPKDPDIPQGMKLLEHLLETKNKYLIISKNLQSYFEYLERNPTLKLDKQLSLVNSCRLNSS